MKSYFHSNLDCPSKIHYPGTAFSIRSASARTECLDRHGHRSNGSGLPSLFGRRQEEQSALIAMVVGGEGAQARTAGHGARQSFYLRDLEEPTG
jgi:hypothetical protein